MATIDIYRPIKTPVNIALYVAPRTAAFDPANGDITARVERDGKSFVLYLSLPASVEECTVKWDDDHSVTVKGNEKYKLRSDE
jgi:hypothetical protein